MHTWRRSRKACGLSQLGTGQTALENDNRTSNEDTTEQGDDETVFATSMGDSYDRPSEQSLAKHLEKYQLSNEANKIVHRAQVLAAFKENTSFVTTSCLLFAIAEGGRDSSDFFRTPQFLWEELRESRTRKIYEIIFNREFPRVQYSSTDGIDFGAYKDLAQVPSTSMLAVLNAAHRFSVKTTRPEIETKSKKASEFSSPAKNQLGVISSRHLFAALLLYQPPDATTGVAAKILSLGVDLMRLRKNFLDFVIKSLPGDDHNAWHEILLPGEARQSGELGIGLDDAIPKEPPTQQTQSHTRVPLPGFLTDCWQGEDLLNITRDVNALASLIAAWTVQPPLSIGLFGYWGSGKTHFMRQLKARVEKLSREARNSGLQQNAVGYYKNIVQIEFNAWHYIEGNLWASLVEHIFTNLKFSDQEDSSLADTRRQVLIEKLDLKRQVKAKAEERKAQLKIKETRARDRAVQAKSSRDDTVTELSRLRDELALNVLNQLSVSIEFTAEQQALLEQLGVPKNSLTSAAAVKKQYLEVQGRYHRVRANWNLWKSDPEQLRKWIVALAGVGILALMPSTFNFFREMLTAYGEVFANIGAFLTSSITFLLTLLIAITPYWKQFRKVLSALQEKADSIEQERQKRILELTSELDVMTQQYKEAEREADTINLQVQELEAEIAGTTTGRLLAEFIEDRAAADDYRRHLGVPALIRRDFEQLSTLFEEQRAEELGGNGATDGNTINRIVLYIDDLDRCPPERVVQVLQAIHLLLAFPLFVVVVSVDPRWMIHSLQESYEWLRTVEHGEEKRPNNPHEFSTRQIATPHDYLEKIFQIPFWLKPMEDVTCRTLLEGLTRDSRIKVVGRDGKDKQKGASEVKTDKVQQKETSAFSDGPVALAARQIASAQQETVGVKMQEEKQSEQATAVRNGEPTAQPASRHIKLEQQQINDEEVIDLAPESLTLSDSEIEYMKELTKLIGRSPRAVKRFLNCYRLIRAGLQPTEIAVFIGKDGKSGEFKAVMILLALITGNPSISLYFLNELEKPLKTGESNTIHTFLNRLDENQEIAMSPDWHAVKGFLENHIKLENMFASMVRVAPKVSRYSFKVASEEITGRNGFS
ncbi:P-loop NTPase fold protein [Nitrosovibrio tenuis]|uniref:P-loop NTPase fold protein n=1 Tax=Nitrosovibrio tenuis TaxID=1233 RepID=UPI001C4328CA|nr:P-loop NTPase fold protein [Nitrosovibrio tenuis]